MPLTPNVTPKLFRSYQSLIFLKVISFPSAVTLGFLREWTAFLVLKIASSPDHARSSFAEEKLCPVPGTIPCKGYGECVMRKWIEEGRTSCIDRSDEGNSEQLFKLWPCFLMTPILYAVTVSSGMTRLPSKAETSAPRPINHVLLSKPVSGCSLVSVLPYKSENVRNTKKERKNLK